jgi:acetyl-CoA acyltransferase
MKSAVIVDAVRTPVGRRNGIFKNVHPVDLASVPLEALVKRNDLDPELIDDVIMGNVSQTGEQAYNVGRNAALAAGFPESVPGVTIDRQCGSSQQSVHFAAQAVMAGVQNVVVAAGVENMTRVPMGITAQQGPGLPFGAKMLERYANGLVPQGISAEMIAEKWGISREELDELSLGSHQRAARATEEGRFEGQIVPVEVTLEDGSTEVVTRDEGIRWDTSLEKLAQLHPAFQADGKITAGNSSQISDGASALLIMSEDKAEELGMEPKARIKTMVLAGVDPVIMLTGPIPATEKALEKAGLNIDDIDLFGRLADGARRDRPDGTLGAHQRQRRSHRPRSSPRSLRWTSDDDPRLGIGAHRWPIRPAVDVRRRRYGQRDDHRESLTDPVRLFP